MKKPERKPIFPQTNRGRRRVAKAQPGFALIVTVSILVLLAVAAVGLLTLSTTVVRTASRDQDNVVARSNARLALMLAIGQLQKHAGDDRRVTMAADQLSDGSDGGETAATYERRQWTGVYKSWDHTEEERPEPEFLGWLVSSPDPEGLNEDAPTNAAGTGAQVELVGEGTMGSGTDGTVTVPVLPMKDKSGNLAWWVGDQGLKAMLALSEEEEPAMMAGVRARLQASPTNAVDLAESNGKGDRPFEKIDLKDERLAALTDWNQAAHFSTSPEAPRPLFHDIVTRSSGLLTNVRRGGFRKDLSMALERRSGSEPKDALYTVSDETGINLQELWAYYNLYKELRNGRGNFTTGGRIPSRTPALTSEQNPKKCEGDDWHYFKQPVVVSYQMVFSLEARHEVLDDRRTRGNRVRLVADPILTFWNPLDVPVIMMPDSYLTVKYWQVPYDLVVEGTKGGTKRCPLQASLSGGTVNKKSDANYLSLEVGKGSRDQMILKPGEVVKFSQSGNKMVKTGQGGVGGGRHTLLGKPGFNYGGGVSLPLRDANGREVVIADGATLTYELFPNRLTCGQTSRSGRSLSGQVQHSRHFSLNHHEFYVGSDRQSNSLGIGGMYIDWDFGNRRLRPNEVRGSSVTGTKISRDRLYANRLPDVFKPITLDEGRPLSAAQLLSPNGKAPIMMISYNAKTENGSDLGTKSLSRFNPKALHVDFYSLSQEERDMLPYEVQIEPLVSWKNRSLETSRSGNAYFGGGLDASTGSTQVTTHSVPHEPLTSLAALQHSFANGFDIQKPKYGYATLNAREPLLPQISHAIGNSLAPPMIKPDKTESVIAGNRPLADHSYLANQGLFDDWFFSTIAPHTVSTYENRMNQKALAEGFLNGEEQLVNSRYVPNVGSRDVKDLMARLFRGSTPTDEATHLTAALMKVDGMFNVNSTSVEAWKVVLAGLNNRSIITRDESGELTITPVSDGIPVAGLTAPTDEVFDGQGIGSVTDQSQWTGRRVLSAEEIDELARALVREVRKRGPFLSLADFVNRRVTYDDQLARAGAIQAALDSDEVSINDAFRSVDREVTMETASRFAFPEAEEGPISQGIAGIVKQADILTPIAPVLSARSDSFVIRAYGEATDQSGNVKARAWCEAVVERASDYLTGEDEPEVLPDDLKEAVDQEFGRVFRVVSFRWLSPDEV